MQNTSPEICLVMIVRDEAHVIERCLESVRPLITQWCIVDTGSRDDTPALIEQALADLPGRLHHREWVDFGHNRSEALALAAGHGEFLLLIDADEVLEIAGDFRVPQDPDVQAWLVRQRIAGTEFEYQLPRLLRADHPWHFQGVVHEYLASARPFKRAPLPGLTQTGHYDSARNRAGEKFRQDIELLERALAENPALARERFYLAQSLRDAGRHAEALEAYRRRAGMGGWEEEIFYARYQAARMLETLAAEQATIVEAYLQAWQSRPVRAEPLVDLARIHRQRGQHHLAKLFAERAHAIERPQDILFVDAAAYRWRAADELALALYATGEQARARQLWQGLLDAEALPESERERIGRNLRLPEAGTTASAQTAIQSRAPPRETRIALTVTTCKRIELFERTIDSFLHNCLDRDRIAEWICIDDNSSAEDRGRMKKRYPFFTFAWKDPAAKGHAASMNMLIELARAGRFSHVLHLEDDWEFLDQRNFIGDALHVMADDPRYGQVLFNRNYAETEADADIIGGEPRTSAAGAVAYRVHQHHAAPATGQARSCAYWPHYSLRPSLLCTGVFDRVGRYNPAKPHFELDYARRYTRAGYLSTFLDTICCRHIGKLTHETGVNAYSLNAQPQFGRPVKED